MNLCNALWRIADQHPQKTAIDLGGEQITYARLKQQVARTNHLLAAWGISPGDRVGLQAAKSRQLVVFHLACLAVGAVVLPLNEAYRSGEVQYCLEDAECRYYIADAERVSVHQKRLGRIAGLQTMVIDRPLNGARFAGDMMKALADNERSPADLPSDAAAFICYTSGTTGKPKGAVLTHENLRINLKDLSRTWRMSKQDAVLHALPVFHVHGLMVCLYLSLLNGATVVMLERFEAKRIWQTLVEKQCTVFMGVPTMYQRLMNTWQQFDVRPNLSRMRLFVSGSAPLLAVQFERFRDQTGFAILERYGMTETIMLTSNPYDPDRRIPGSVGYPLPSVTLCIKDSQGVDVPHGTIGEVCVKGGNVFKEYWKRPDKTRAAHVGAWFKTGDLGYLDAADNGRLYLVGRAKELIISGGYNVYPKEVENILQAHPAVRESAVLGLPDDDFGERVVAAVILNSAHTIAENALIEYCRRHLAAYKCPKTVFVVSDLPRNRMGKILKQDLGARLTGHADSPDMAPEMQQKGRV